MLLKPWAPLLGEQAALRTLTPSVSRGSIPILAKDDNISGGASSSSTRSLSKATAQMAEQLREWFFEVLYTYIYSLSDFVYSCSFGGFVCFAGP